MQVSLSPTPHLQPGRFATSRGSVAGAIGFAPELSSEPAGWSNLALYGWRGQCREADFEPFDEPVIVYHVGGATTIPVRVGRSWNRSTHPGLLTIIPPHTPISWSIRGEVFSRSVHLGSKFFSAADDGAGTGTPALKFRCGIQDPLLTSSIQALERELRQPREHGTLYADTVSDFMALHLLRDNGWSAPPVRKREALSRTKLRCVLELLESSIETGISLQSLADEAVLSRAYFSTVFRHATGQSPHRYLTQRRLARARELLCSTAMSLADVALRCGFSSQAHFTEYFRRENGVTPNQWRREQQHD